MEHDESDGDDSLQSMPTLAADNPALDDVMEELEPTAAIVVPEQSTVFCPMNLNIARRLINVQYGAEKGFIKRNLELRNSAVIADLNKFQDIDSRCRFDRRITEVSWHPNEPYIVAAGCKRGDLMILTGAEDPENHGTIKFSKKFIAEGPGADGAIFSLRFDSCRPHLLYTAGLEGIVKSLNIEKQTVCHEFFNTNNWRHWFTSMDVSRSTRTLLAGCTKGYVYLSTLDGEIVDQIRLHKGKVHHCEFNQAVPHLIVTSSGDKTVKLWDLRKLQEKRPLEIMEHEKPVNVAHFSPTNPGSLLTSDQKDEIRVYHGPKWNLSLTIKHPHRQFQHLTPIVANWHPLCDLIVIGKYPMVPRFTKTNSLPPRPIQFFDASSGNLVSEIHPPINTIVSINAFNRAGDTLAAGQGRSLIFFRAEDESQRLKAELNRMKAFQGAMNDIRIDNGWPEVSDDSDGDVADEKKVRTKKRKKQANGKKATHKKSKK